MTMSTISHIPASRWNLGWAALALFAVTLLAFSPALRNSWTGWDDTAYVLNNPLVTGTSTPAAIWTSGDNEQYYPLTFTSYWVQWRLFGDRAGGYHAVNVVLHALNAVLCLAVLRELRLTRLAAVLGAGLFAIHPTQVISVAWIAEHKNTLCGVFALTAMFCWIRSRGGERPTGWYLGALLAFALAMLAKTAVVGLPISLLVLDRLVLGVRGRSIVARIAPMLLIAGALGGLTYFFEQKFVDRVSAEWMPDAGERVRIAAAAPWVYMWHLIWPFKLSIAYELWILRAWWWGISVAALAAGIGWALAAQRLLAGAAPDEGDATESPTGLMLWGIAHYILILGPTLGLIPYGNLAVTYVSDHFLYLASIGLFAPLAGLVDRVRRGPAVGLAICALALLPVTFRDTRVFHDAVSLWSRAVEVAPGNYTARLGLAEGLSRAGDSSGAAEEYRRALEIRPEWPDGWLFLAQSHEAEGEPGQAEAAYRRALTLAPGFEAAATGLAGVLERQGKLSEALALFEETVARHPGLHAPRLGLAKMYLGYGRFADALSQFQAVMATELYPAWAPLGAAQCLRSLGRDAEAVTTLEPALQRFPDNAPLMNMAARLRATSRDEAVRDGALAVSLAERAASASQESDPMVLETLAAAYAEAGRPSEASSTARRAAGIMRRLGLEDRAAGAEALAAEYANGVTLRE